MSEILIQDGVILSGVPAGDVQIYEVVCEKSFLDLIG